MPNEKRLRESENRGRDGMARWMGVLFYIGEESAGTPGGCLGHKAKFSLPAAVDVKRMIAGTWIATAHTDDTDREIFGVVEECEIIDNAVVVSGTADIGSRKVVDLSASSKPLGMSIEAKEAEVRNIRSDVFEIIGVGRVDGAAVAENASFRSAFWWL